MSSVFEFSVTYDEDSVRLASRTFFMQVYGRLLRWIVLLFALSLTVAVLLRISTGASWLNWLMVALALSHLSLVYLYWAQARRMVRAFKGTARVRLTDTELSIASERGSHAWPWKAFRFARRDPKNVLLFVARAAAVVVPTNGAPEAAVDFVMVRVSRGE